MHCFSKFFLNFFVLLTMHSVASAENFRFNCSYETLKKGNVRKVDIFYDLKNDWSRIVNETDRTNGDAKSSETELKATVDETSFIDEYTVNKRTLAFKLVLKNDYSKKDTVLIGRCEPHERQTLSTYEKCEVNSDLAKSIMTVRQKNIALSKLTALHRGEEPTLSMVTEAYESPRFSSEAMKTQAIENFRDKFYLKCIRNP